MSEEGLSHPIRKGAVLRVTSDEENVEPVLYVSDRLRDIDTGEIRYGLCDPTNTGFYDYHQDDADDLFVDTGLTSDRTKPISDPAIQELYEDLCDHRWTAVHDPDTMEESGFMCIACRASRDELGGDDE